MTGWVWDERYMWHDTGHQGWFLPEHGSIEPLEHLESAPAKRRLRNLVEVSGLAAQLAPIEPQRASDDDLLRVHSSEHIARIEEFSAGQGGQTGDQVVVGPGSAAIARLAAGGCIAAVRAVLAAEIANAYALVRPPGHHAERERARGYCMYSNVAIAVLHAIEAVGVERVAIIDWDVHHGNGTQAAFWRDPRVLTVSIHQDRYFPAETGSISELGEGPGRGLNINIPLPAGSGVGAYDAAFTRVVAPAVRRHDPGLIVVACGFDAGMLEPQGQMLLHSGDFRELTRWVMELAAETCDGRLVLCHEGGYSPLYVPFCGLAVIEQLAGVRTPIADPYEQVFAQVGGRELRPHQAAVVAEVAAICGLGG